ncbi:hypothetical protein N431DRAFT_433681 [Stipitochalara longipes BDJ]|nr:hypothetical protein N431DRAFT_433681 [Stipitochalara longipes BDJ]
MSITGLCEFLVLSSPGAPVVSPSCPRSSTSSGLPIAAPGCICGDHRCSLSTPLQSCVHAASNQSLENRYGSRLVTALFITLELIGATQRLILLLRGTSFRTAFYLS